MRKQKVYLETTMFSRYFETERDYFAETIKMPELVNRLNGLKGIYICSPMEVVENDD